MPFHDRHDAGARLAAALERYRDAANTIVIALPRGGVVVGAEVARRLELPLDIVVTRKIGAPGNPEYAIGAITESGDPVLDHHAIALTDASEEYIELVVATERIEAVRRLRKYRGDRAPRNINGKTVLLVDDGIATGYTIRAAIRTLRSEHAQQIILAVPIAAADTIARLRTEIDDVIALEMPEGFVAVAQYYDQFAQVTDEEVVASLQ